MKKTIFLITTVFFAITCMSMALLAHDDGHSSPDTLPVIGPHGGQYAKLTKHFAEVVVSGKTVTVYILEKDVKHVAEDASAVAAVMKIPGKAGKKLKLVKKGKGYQAKIKIPRRTRRVYFHISCVLDGKKETGKILYEPRR
ncbi:MAG: hypothetical protein GY754_35510 [bacterium]|nr:hypothetical protein [bacterium]